MCRSVTLLFLAATLAVTQAAPADLSGPRPWSRLNSPNFELYTDAGEDTGAEIIRYFEQLRAFFMRATPVRPPDGFPVRVIAFKDGADYARYAPVQRSGAYFTTSPSRDYIVMSGTTPDSYPNAVHEYMHLVVRHSGLHLPLWLNEGWSDVYSSLKPVRNGEAIGDLLPARMQALKAADGKWIDFETLTSVTVNSPIYHEGDRTGLFYAESWAFAHMLFLAPDYRDRFGPFLLALHRGSSAADACQSAFGKSSAQVFLDLQNYFSRKKMFGRVFETGPNKTDAATSSTALSAFAAGLMLADLLATVGQYDAARSSYEELEKGQPASAEVMQSLGYLALMRQDQATALRYLEKAFTAGDADPQMCLRLALLGREVKRPPEVVAAYLERAVRSKPDYTDALLQLGLQRAAMRQFEPAVKAFMSIRNVTPEQAPQLFSALAYSDLGTGDLESARKHIDTARKWSKSTPEMKILDGLSELVEARARSPYPPHPGEKLVSVAGALQAVECTPGRNRLRLVVGESSMSFDLPEAQAVEFSSSSQIAGTAVQLKCGPTQPVPVKVEYVPVSVLEQGVAGVVRRIEY